MTMVSEGVSVTSFALGVGGTPRLSTPSCYGLASGPDAMHSRHPIHTDLDYSVRCATV